VTAEIEATPEELAPLIEGLADSMFQTAHINSGGIPIAMTTPLLTEPSREMLRRAAALLRTLSAVTRERDEARVWDENAECFYTAKQLQELLNWRDDFIVSEGLWEKFVKSIAHRQSSTTGSGT
jgi:hypothetical protein